MIDNNILLQEAKKILEDILSFYEYNINVSVKITDIQAKSGPQKIVEIEIPTGAYNSFLIGVNGEILTSLQLLVGAALRKKVSGDDDSIVVRIDVGGYKNKKKEDLVVRVKEWAKKVESSGIEIKLPWMSSLDRLVVHQVVADEFSESIKSESSGEGRDRVITLKKKSQSQEPML